MLERVVALALLLFALVWATSLVGTPDDPPRGSDAPVPADPSEGDDGSADRHRDPPAPDPQPERAPPREPAPEPRPSAPRKDKGLLGGLLGPG